MNVVQISACNLLGSPPAYLDLTWKQGANGRWMAHATPLARVSFERTRRGPRQAGLTLAGDVVSWDLTQAPPQPRLDALLRGWERMAQQEIALRAAREAVRRPVGADALGSVQRDLADMLASASWAFRSKVWLAEGFAHAASLTPGQHRFAAVLLSEARDVLAAVDRRLAEPAAQEALSLSESREADLLEACRALTAMDEDRARDANGHGWDAVSSPAGHRLAGRDVLSPVEAGHAWQLVHRHRGQLRRDLRERLFG